MSDIQSFHIVIGRRLRWWRLDRKLTQQQLADHLELHREAISELEAGRRKLTFVEAQLLHTRWGMPFTALTTDRYRGP